MKKLYITLFILILAASSVTAKVAFITEDPEGDAGFSVIKGTVGSSGSTVEGSNQFKCNAEGYIRTICGEGQSLVERCPYDSRYYKTCCSDDYDSDRDECIAGGGRPSSLPCGGKYRCN